MGTYRLGNLPGGAGALFALARLDAPVPGVGFCFPKKPHIFAQRALIAFEREHVIGPCPESRIFLAMLPLTPHRINRDVVCDIKQVQHDWK